MLVHSIFCLPLVNGFWIIGGRNLCKKITRSCETCFRQSPKSINPVMNNPSNSRVKQSYPFQNTEIFYNGPFLNKDKKDKVTKCYFCYLFAFLQKLFIWSYKILYSMSQAICLKTWKTFKCLFRRRF